MPRILSEHGNVIAADFRPSISLKFSSQRVYQDEHVLLMRVTTTLDGEPCGRPSHFLCDLHTGRHTEL